MQYPDMTCYSVTFKNSQFKLWLCNLSSGREEVKTLVDLAMMSADESDIQTDRVSCLHTTALGFAPFIFDLRTNMLTSRNWWRYVQVSGKRWKGTKPCQWNWLDICMMTQSLKSSFAKLSSLEQVIQVVWRILRNFPLYAIRNIEMSPLLGLTPF